MLSKYHYFRIACEKMHVKTTRFSNQMKIKKMLLLFYCFSNQHCKKKKEHFFHLRDEHSWIMKQINQQWWATNGQYKVAQIKQPYSTYMFNWVILFDMPLLLEGRSLFYTKIMVKKSTFDRILIVRHYSKGVANLFTLLFFNVWSDTTLNTKF